MRRCHLLEAFLVPVVLGFAACGEGSPAPAPTVEGAGTRVAADRVTQIHSIWDLVQRTSVSHAAVAPAAGESPAEAKPSPDLALRTLVAQIERTATAEGWPDSATAQVGGGSTNLVVKASRGYHQALDTYLTRLRADSAK